MSEWNAAADVSAIRNAIDKIRDRLCTQGAAADNEESTKWAFILPFLRDVLGYNVENPLEVQEEYTADVGGNKGEKVDIAILNDDSEHTPRILIECKKLSVDLTQENDRRLWRQLWRYFVASDGVRFGILTNGRLWKLYTDMDKDNLMDDEPYAVLDVLNPDSEVIALLQDITKEGLDSGKAREDAERYHKMRLIRRRLDHELLNPSLNFVKLLAGELVAKGTHDHTVETEYKPLVVDALEEYKSRLKKAEMDEEGSDSRQRGAEESDDAAAVGTGTAEPGEAEQEQPERNRRGPSVQDLVNAGLLHDGDELICATASGRYQDVVATVRGDGGIEIEGQPYYKPSPAAESVTGYSENGWKFWRLRDGRTLKDLRDAYGRGSSVHD